MSIETTERPSTTVVTSENLVEFNNARMGMDRAEVPGEVVGEATEVADAEEGEKKPPAKPKKGPINDRMSELTAQRREAERERDEAKRERDELRAQLNPPAPAPAPAADPKEPKPEDFPNAFDYARELAQFEAKKAVAADRAERLREAEEQKAQASHAKVADSWKTRAEAVKTELPDYEEVLAASTVAVSNAVRDALMESEFGPRILYEMATDPELADKLRDGNPQSKEEEASIARAQLKLIGKLETRFEKTEETEVAEAPAPAPERPRAPAPIVPVRGTKTADVPVDSKGEFTGSYQDFKRLNKAGKI